MVDQMPPKSMIAQSRTAIEKFPEDRAEADRLPRPGRTGEPDTTGAMGAAGPIGVSMAVDAADGAGAAAMVPAVERAVRLLDALANARRAPSLAEIARDLALPKSSVHGLLGTLTALGLAARRSDGGYALGPKPLQWADAFAQQSDVIAAFNDATADAAGAFGQAHVADETVMLAVLDGADVLYLACRPGRRALGVNFRVGGRFPACCTSTGKAMLATLPEARVRALMADGGLRRLTRHGVASAAALLRQLAEVREAGCAVDDEETAEGMHCFGAAVHAAGREEAVAAVAVSLIKAQTTPRRRTEIVAAVRALASEISRRLGSAVATR